MDTEKGKQIEHSQVAVEDVRERARADKVRRLQQKMAKRARRKNERGASAKNKSAAAEWYRELKDSGELATLRQNVPGGLLALKLGWIGLPEVSRIWLLFISEGEIARSPQNYQLVVETVTNWGQIARPIKRIFNYQASTKFTTKRCRKCSGRGHQNDSWLGRHSQCQTCQGDGSLQKMVRGQGVWTDAGMRGKIYHTKEKSGDRWVFEEEMKGKIMYKTASEGPVPSTEGWYATRHLQSWFEKTQRVRQDPLPWRRGRVEVSISPPIPAFRYRIKPLDQRKQCQKCKGTGRVWRPRNKSKLTYRCVQCKGRGYNHGTDSRLKEQQKSDEEFAKRNFIRRSSRSTL